jgi:hypothetical protein
MHHTSWILLPLLLLVSVSCSTPDAGHERLTRQQLSSWVSRASAVLRMHPAHSHTSTAALGIHRLARDSR